MLFIVITLFLALAVFFATSTLLRPAPRSSETGSRTQLYQNQVAEIDREEMNGLISQGEALALRTEAQRRLLSAADEAEKTHADMPLGKTPTALLMAGLIVMGGGGIYASLGQPGVPSVARAATDLRTQSPASNSNTAALQIPGGLDGVITQLKEKLQTEPQDAESWRMLGWSYYNQGRYAEAVEAYKKAVDLAPENVDFLSAYGEARLGVNEGEITPDIEKIFNSVLAIDPKEPRARFFKGLALDQAGDTDSAITIWVDMVNNAPPGAPWAEDVMAQMKARAESAGIDIGGRLKARTATPPSPAPSRADIDAAMQMSPQERQKMIEGMVASLSARLEANPNDPQGWVRLIRSQITLGQKDKAKISLRAAATYFKDRPDVRAKIIDEAQSFGADLK